MATDEVQEEGAFLFMSGKPAYQRDLLVMARQFNQPFLCLIKSSRFQETIVKSFSTPIIINGYRTFRRLAVGIGNSAFLSTSIREVVREEWQLAQ